VCIYTAAEMRLCTCRYNCISIRALVYLHRERQWNLSTSAGANNALIGRFGIWLVSTIGGLL